METTNGLEPAQFSRNFLFLKPLILETWPEVDRKALHATGGDLDRIVELVARSTDHHDLVRRQLAQIAQEGDPGELGMFARLNRSVRRLELQTGNLFQNAGYQATDAVSAHVWRNLFLTLFGGLLIGLILGSSRSRSRD